MPGMALGIQEGTVMMMPNRSGWVLSVLCVAVFWMPVAQARCFGLSASAIGCDTKDGSCIGTHGKDVITCVNAAGCVMQGGAGDDFLFGGPGPDTICGGSGNDVVQGGPGSDVMTGDSNDDLAIGDSSFFTETDLFEFCDAELVFTCEDILLSSSEAPK